MTLIFFPTIGECHQYVFNNKKEVCIKDSDSIGIFNSMFIGNQTMLHILQRTFESGLLNYWLTKIYSWIKLLKFRQLHH